ncbi:MAG: VWA domain-containing protein [Promethearchaeota archaeon]|nr:MAG: VWA domain-containing protein [Candidatus Lokiarchaeota archaeon]
MRKHEKCAYKPSIRQAIAISKLILARYLNRGICLSDDFVEIAVITSPLENQSLARKVATEILSYNEAAKVKILDPMSIDPNLFSEVTGSDLISEFDEEELSELEDVLDDFEFLSSFFDELIQSDMETILDSLKNNFFEKYGDMLFEDPYKAAIEFLLKNSFENFDILKDLNDLIETAKKMLKEKLNHLDPEDIQYTEKLDLLDEIIDGSESFREKLSANLAKNGDFDKFLNDLEEKLRGNFFEGLGALNFGLSAGLLDDENQQAVKEMLKSIFTQVEKNINDLLEASRVMGTKLGLNKEELEQIIENSMDYPFDDTYNAIKNLDQYFGEQLCDDFLNKMANSIDDLEMDEDLIESLISNPTRTPSWRQLLKNRIDNKVKSILENNDYQETISSDLKNFTNKIISEKGKCFDLACRSQINDLTSDLVNTSIENSWNPDDLTNSVTHYNEQGIHPDINSIKNTGKRLNMSNAEIMRLISSDYQVLEEMIEEGMQDYNAYKNILNNLNLNYPEVNNLVQLSLKGNDPSTYNLEALSALSEKYLSNVLNSANSLGSDKLNAVLSSLGAGSGLDLLEQWFYSRHNLPPRVKNKLKEIIKQIMIDLGIRSANSLIGSANSGPLVENVVIPYNIGDDFDLIDLEETVSNLLDGGKTIEMIEEDDFLVSKTTEGLRCLVMELDISGSMIGEKLAQMALCTTMLIYAFKPEELALTFFESNTHKLKNLDEEIEIEKVADELLDIEARGGTCIHSALEWANLQFDKKARSKYKLNILFTDADVFDFYESKRELEKMKDGDIRFVMVVPQFHYSPVMAKNMVTEANGVLLTLDQWRNFPKLISDIISNQ